MTNVHNIDYSDEALSHPWLNDRQNLETRALAQAQKRANMGVDDSEGEERWSLSQQVANVVKVVFNFTAI